MENTVLVQEENSTFLPDLPADVWNEIFGWLTADVKVQETYYEESKEKLSCKIESSKKMKSIKKLIPLTKVCKKFNSITAAAIKKYLLDAECLIDKFGGKYDVLVKTIELFDEDDRINLCLKLGADINAPKYAVGKKIVSEKCTTNETLLTKFIKEKNNFMINKVLRFNANPCSPNGMGEFPIDIAYNVGEHQSVKILKDKGGDPENRYIYDGKNYVVGSIDSDRKNSLKDSRQVKKDDGEKITVPIDDANNNNTQLHQNSSRKKHPVPKFTLRRNRIIFIFIVGVVVSSVSYWLYSQWQEHKKQKEQSKKDQQPMPENQPAS